MDKLTDQLTPRQIENKIKRTQALNDLLKTTNVLAAKLTNYLNQIERQRNRVNLR